MVEAGRVVIEVTVLIVWNGDVLVKDTAYGNTRRTAMAAGHALGNSIASEYAGAHYVVKCGAISEIRKPAVT